MQTGPLPREAGPLLEWIRSQPHLMTQLESGQNPPLLAAVKYPPPIPFSLYTWVQVTRLVRAERTVAFAAFASSNAPQYAH